MTYHAYTVRIKFITNKLREQVLMSGYRENLGSNDERKFIDDLEKSDLTYSEKHKLKERLRVAIENI